MKLPLLVTILFFTATFSYAQSGREVHGTVIDSTKLGVPSSTITLTSDQHDSTTTISDLKGKFIFPSVKGNKIVITISSIGYQGLKKHFTLANDNIPADLGSIVLKIQSNMLNQVNIVGVVPVTLKEDTVEYKASAYKVRENAPVEDLIKKLPGVDVDVNGNITTQGKQVTKVRINGKDFMGGDVQSATKNLPADVVENIQMIDDYGDQANLTGIKTGEPDKIMNITIRKDKNYGYFGQGTAGAGEDLLPESAGIPNQTRYIGSLNAFNFNGDQQIALLGSVNNTNVNTFSFGSAGGGGGGGFGGGGGRGNAARGGGGGNSGSLITSQNGITDAHSIGANFRDQWGKALSVYGSYSFSDNTVNTVNDIFQQNTSPVNPTLQDQNSIEKDQNINHRFTWNMEYKPDTINYLKVVPTFSYAGSNTNLAETVNLSGNDTTRSAYNSLTNGYSHAPNFGLTALFNHRFKHRRNLNINLTLSSSSSTGYQNPVYDYTVGEPTAPINQMINTYSHTNSYGISFSYLEPLSKVSYLEFNYAFNRSITDNNKQTDTLYDPSTLAFRNDSALSNMYNYTFTTNKFGLNYRFIEKKYNFTLGVGAQPSVLDGSSPAIGVDTHYPSFNIIPTARFTYNFSRSRNFSINYNASSSTPSFSQLQPVIDFSNALYPVEGNPLLKPQFTNNFSIRYNNFSFTTGDIFFISLQHQEISDYVATNTTTFPRKYPLDPRFENTILTEYVNTDGYSHTSGQVTYAKPWDNRKFTLTFRGTASYTNNVGFLTDVDSVTYAKTTEKNIAKNLAFTPQVQFRVDITDIIDAQLLTNYAINRTNNSVKNDFTNGTSNIRTWNIGLNGKNYFGDWTFSYDFTKATNYGYSSNINVTNPNILNLYVERRFMKDHRGTIRISAFDLFNQNTGFTSSTTASSITETHVNRLSRYFLATFTLRLQKFAGKAPTRQEPRMRGFRRDGGGTPGGPPPGGGPNNND
ncbi:MAG TPA: outer membrane beta-barrel protein [Mucilaginibacter sp.]